MQRISSSEEIGYPPAVSTACVSSNQPAEDPVRPLVFWTPPAIRRSATPRIRPEVPTHLYNHVLEVSAPNWRWILRLVRCNRRQQVCSWGFWEGFVRGRSAALGSLLV